MEQFGPPHIFSDPVLMVTFCFVIEKAIEILPPCLHCDREFVQDVLEETPKVLELFVSRNLAHSFFPATRLAAGVVESRPWLVLAFVPTAKGRMDE